MYTEILKRRQEKYVHIRESDPVVCVTMSTMDKSYEGDFKKLAINPCVRIQFRLSLLNRQLRKFASLNSMLVGDEADAN